ncbi:helix-turn-helix domain-containing protein [Haloactinomyces albus]|nr:helix-turn-helix transcriptional regulator [Haloactinomyces albus]
MVREPETIAETRRTLGAQLAAFRQAADLTQGQLAKAAFCDRTTVTHIEKGRARADERFWRACDEAVGAGGALLAAFHDLVASKHAYEQREQQTRLAVARARAERLTTNGHPAPSTSATDDVGLVGPPAPPVRLDSVYVETLHSRIRELIDLDTRVGGDHSSGLALQLLILQNMSMHAGHLGRPVEALRIARMMLETNKLSPRLETLFRTREARALALAGDETAAERMFRRARLLYLDGVCGDDLAWAWWINEQELAWHEAMIRVDSADWGSAVDAFQASIEVTLDHEVRRRYHHLAALLDVQVRVAAWRGADRTVQRVLPYVDEIGSTRTVTTLLGVIDRLGTTRATPSVGEAAGQLGGILTSAGYGH